MICRGLFGVATLQIAFSYLTLPLAVAGSWNVVSLPEDEKRFIVRVVNPQNMLGTGFILHDSSKGFFLVTNRHVVADSVSNELFDSVMIYDNLKSPSGKVSSTNIGRTLYLSYRGHSLFREPSDTNIDLIVVRLGPLDMADSNLTNPSGNPWIFGFKTRLVIPPDVFRPCKHLDGVQIQLIGFSSQLPQTEQFHISRFGHVAYYACDGMRLKVGRRVQIVDWLVVDVTSRGGDSGGPVFAVPKNREEPLLIGFVQGNQAQDELCIAIPSYHILQLINEFDSGAR